MRVITRGALQRYWETPGREDAEEPLRAWYAEAKAAAWRSPAQIKNRYRSASFVGEDRVAFDIGGSKHRLVVHVNYGLGIMLIKFVGFDAEYDAIDLAAVGGGGRSQCW